MKNAKTVQNDNDSRKEVVVKCPPQKSYEDELVENFDRLKQTGARQ